MFGRFYRFLHELLDCPKRIFQSPNTDQRTSLCCVNPPQSCGRRTWAFRWQGRRNSFPQTGDLSTNLPTFPASPSVTVCAVKRILSRSTTRRLWSGPCERGADSSCRDRLWMARQVLSTKSSNSLISTWSLSLIPVVRCPTVTSYIVS